MAAEVSSMVREVSGYEAGQGKRDLVTRDLLGAGKNLGHRDADVEHEVQVDWSVSSESVVLSERHDLNLPPPSSCFGGVVESSSSLDLTLSAIPTCTYRSVCTLEKVKLALERAERESRKGYRRDTECGSSSSHSPSCSKSTSLKLETAEVHDSYLPDTVSAVAGGMAAAGCPGCLLYVLISTADPRCPRCHSYVPILGMRKRPRLDLNSC